MSRRKKPFRIINFSGMLRFFARGTSRFPSWYRKLVVRWSDATMIRSLKSVRRTSTKMTTKVQKRTLAKLCESKTVRSIKDAQRASTKITSKVQRRTMRSWYSLLARVFTSKWFRATAQINKKTKHKWFVCLDQFIEKIDKSPLLKAMFTPVRWLYLITSRTIEFCIAWSNTRSYMQLIPASVSIILALPLTFFMVRAPLYSNQQKAKHYRQAAHKAIDKNRTDTAELYNRKLMQLGVETDRDVYRRAIRLAEDGKTDEALDLLLTIAPHNEIGLPAAHYWIGNAVLFDIVKVPKEMQLPYAEHHLKIAYDANPDSSYTTKSLALIYRLQGETKKSLELVSRIRINDLSAEGMMQIASVYKSLGKHQAANSLASRAQEFWENEPQPAAHRTRDHYLLRASSLELRGRYVDALKILQEGIDSLNDATLYDAAQQGCSTLVIALSVVPSREDDWLSLVRFGLQHNLLTEEAQIQMVHRISNQKKFIEVLEKDFVEAYETGNLARRPFAILAEVVYEKGHVELAKQIYSLVADRNPNDLVVVNNLAWLLSNESPFDLDHALELATRVIAADPQNAAFRDTRGQILRKQQKWTEALVDLEFAAVGLPDDQSVFAALSECYRNTGNEQLAAAYEKRSDALKAWATQ